MISRRMGFVLTCAWLAGGQRCLGASPLPTSAPVLSPALAELFEQLNADSFQKREAASQQLANYGQLIRPALLEATRRDQPPELRYRAAQLLCPLSWSIPEDTAPVRQTLNYYASTDPEIRARAVTQLGLIGPSAFDALIRLFREEPNDDVRWRIVQQLRIFTLPEQRRRLQQLDASPDDAPALAAAGWAWQSVDPARGEALLRRAADLAAQHPSDNLESPVPGREYGVETFTEPQRLFRWLTIRAIQTGDYDAAAHRTRQLIQQGEAPLSDAMLDLFVIHADYGPRRGFEADLRLAEKSFYSPEMMYVIGRMHAHQNRPLLATACYRAAALSALATQRTHLRVARFLLGRRWYDLCQIECDQALACAGPDKTLIDAEVYVLLSHCASNRGEDALAADSLATALRLVAQLPGTTFKFEARLRAEQDWYALRDAEHRQDKAAMARAVDRLMDYHPAEDQMELSGDTEIDLIRGLKALDRSDAAARRFGPQFESYRKQLEAEPNSAEVLNNIAWYCARCHEHAEDAVRWSAAAIRLAPADAAYLDTAAEAAAEAGRWEDAVKYETAALRIQPGDRFMMRQLVRFRSGK